MSSISFGKLLKKLRLATGLTMREFCLEHGFDAGNFSRLERGVFPPPQREDLLGKYAEALGLARGTEEWIEFFDVAAASRGEIPKDLLGDQQLVDKLPALFRTLRGQPVSSAQLDSLVEKVRRS